MKGTKELVRTNHIIKVMYLKIVAENKIELSK
jgi:hypothetical protein